MNASPSKGGDGPHRKTDHLQAASELSWIKLITLGVFMTTVCLAGIWICFKVAGTAHSNAMISIFSIGVVIFTGSFAFCSGLIMIGCIGGAYFKIRPKTKVSGSVLNQGSATEPSK